MVASCEITISNKKGLHARASAKLVKLAETFSAHILVKKNRRDPVEATSILGLLTLDGSCGTKIEIIAEGDDEEEAIEAVHALFNRKFDEKE